MSEDQSGPEPVAEIETDGWRWHLYDDWAWRRAPGPDPPGDWKGYPEMLHGKLRELGRVGDPLPNLYHTALAGAGVVFGKVVRWWGDHSGDPQKALDEFLAEEGEFRGPLKFTVATILSGGC